jgi:hypothetical protein
MSPVGEQRVPLGAWLHLEHPDSRYGKAYSETVFVAFVDDDNIPGVEPDEIEERISGPDEIEDFIRCYDDEPFASKIRLHYDAEDRTAFETELACE